MLYAFPKTNLHINPGFLFMPKTDTFAILDLAKNL